MRSRGFSLIELIAVIAIVTILVAIVFPLVSGIKERGRRAFCINNLKQWGTAFNLFMADNNGELPNDNSTTTSISNWQNQMASYLSLPILTNSSQINLSDKSIQNMFQIRICPSYYHEAKGIGRDVFNSSGSAKYLYSYCMNHNLDGVGAADSNDPTFPIAGRVGDADKLVLVFTTPHYNLVGDYSQTVFQGANQSQWTVTHRALRKGGGKNNLNGAGFQAVFFSGSARFVPITYIFTNTTGSPQFITNHPEISWFPEIPLN